MSSSPCVLLSLQRYRFPLAGGQLLPFFPEATSQAIDPSASGFYSSFPSDR